MPPVTSGSRSTAVARFGATPPTASLREVRARPGAAEHLLCVRRHRACTALYVTTATENWTDEQRRAEPAPAWSIDWTRMPRAARRRRSARIQRGGRSIAEGGPHEAARRQRHHDDPGRAAVHLARSQLRRPSRTTAGPASSRRGRLRSSASPGGASAAIGSSIISRTSRARSPSSRWRCSRRWHGSWDRPEARPELTRRNVLTRGIDLDSLIGDRVRGPGRAIRQAPRSAGRATG